MASRSRTLHLIGRQLSRRLRTQGRGLANACLSLRHRHIDGVSLFCYTMVMDDHGKGKTHDFELMKLAQAANTFIFACDHWVVFSDEDRPLNP